MKFDVSNQYAENSCSAKERDAYFKALNDEIEHGGLEAMLYDMLYDCDLKDWHPRMRPADAGLWDQKVYSLDSYDQWLHAVLQEGELPWSPLYTNDERPFHVLMTDLKARISDADARWVNNTAFGLYLTKQKILMHRTNTVSLRRFPPLKQMREDWEKRFGAWRWDVELDEWQQSSGQPTTEDSPRGRLRLA